MELRVLGPLEVISNQGTVTISGSMPRRLLALLGLTPGREVPTAELIAGLWPDAVSDGAGATLQSHVARLRRALPDGKRIQTGPSGYCLDLDPSDLDETAFVRAISDGHQALTQGQPSVAIDAFQRALDLWRGRPYAEFVGCPPLEIESTRLEQLRVDALRGMLAAQLALDDVEPPVAQLRALVQLHPADEPMWSLLMLALYRTGQQAAALDAFQQARAHLVEELGIEPGPELQAMEHRILSGDPRLYPKTRMAPVPIASAGVADRQLDPERRTTTVVAIRVLSPGSTDPETIADSYASVEAAVRPLAEAYGAAPTPSAAGTLILAFGALRAHEDDPHRAVHLSWRAVEQARSSGATVCVGIATGAALALYNGAEVAITGAPVSTALRLADEADGQEVLVDGSTVELVQLLPGFDAVFDGVHNGDFRIVGPPADPRPRDVSRTPLVGRSGDLAVLRAAFKKTVSDRQVQLVAVIGEPGIGKTRLVSEFQHELELSGPSVSWVTTNCRPFGESDAFQGISDIVRAIAGIRTGDSVDDAVEKVVAALPAGERDRMAPRLLPLVRAPDHTSPDRSASFAAWSRFIEIAAESLPVVIHVDDLQWAPPLLRDFIDYTYRTDMGAPVLWLVSSRTETFDSESTDDRMAVRGTELHLRRLPDAEIDAMLAGLCDERFVGEGQLLELTRLCAGVPLFAEEIARLASTGAPVPTFEAIIGARLDTLDSLPRRLLAVAAVAGQQVTTEFLASAMDMDPDNTAMTVDHLVRREFLVRQTDDSGRRSYSFIHDLPRQVAYDRLPRAERARAHMAVADWWARTLDTDEAAAELVGVHASTARSLALEVADDALEERSRALAVRSNLLVGQRLQGLDTPTALTKLEATVELVENDSLDEAVTRLWLGAVLFDDRQFLAAQMQLRFALERLVQLDDPRRVDAAIFSLTCSFALGHPFDAELDVLRSASTSLGPTIQLVRALSALGMVAVMGQTASDQHRAIELADTAINIADGLSGVGTAFAHVVHGRALLSLGKSQGLDELVDWLDDVELEEPGTIALGLGQWLAGAQHHWVGPVAEWETRKELANKARTRGLDFITSFGIAEEIRVLWELGRHHEAVELADSTRTGDVAVDAQARWAVVQRAMALAELGDLRTDDVERVRDTPPADPGDLRHVLGAALVIARWELDHGDFGAAATALRSVGPLANFVERDGAVELLPGGVRLACALSCEDLLEGLGPDMDGRTPLRRILKLHVEGLLAAGRGEIDTAAGLLTEAAVAWESRSSVTEGAHARSDLMRLGLDHR